jgi:hypothetical protein
MAKQVWRNPGENSFADKTDTVYPRGAAALKRHILRPLCLSNRRDVIASPDSARSPAIVLS